MTEVKTTYGKIQKFSFSCLYFIIEIFGIPRWLSDKESSCIVEDTGSIPGSGRSLEKEITTQFSVFAWEIPWMEKPGGLQPMGLQSCIQLSN